MTIAYAPQLTECCASTATMPAPFDIYAMVESFGGIGDGVSDDTDAFVRALADGRPIGLAANRSYAISGVIVDAATTCPGIFSLGGQARIVPVAPNPIGYCFAVRKLADFVVDGIFFDLPISTDPLVAPGWDRAIGFAPDGDPSVGRRFTIRNCRFSGAQKGVTFNGAFDNCRVASNYFTGMWGEAISVQAAHNFDIVDNIIEDGGHGPGGASGAIRTGYSQQIEASLNVRIAGNTIARYNQVSGQSAIDCFSGAARNLQITDNIVEVCGSGIELKTMDWTLGTPDVYRANLIANNIVRLRSETLPGGTTGITLFYAVTGTVAGKAGRMLVSGNLISGVNPPASGSGVYGIIANGFDDMMIADNHIHNVATGIAISGHGETDAIARRITISGNTVDAVDGAIARAATVSTIDGLYIVGNPMLRNSAVDGDVIALDVGTTTNCEISGNTIESVAGYGIDMRDMQASRITGNTFRTAKSCIRSFAPASAGVAIAGNRLVATVGPALALAAGTALVVQGNDVELPAGSVSVSGAATFTAAGNTRGLRAAIPDATFGGALGDTFGDSTAATAGWRCTTAGAAGVAVYTVI